MEYSKQVKLISCLDATQRLCHLQVILTYSSLDGTNGFVVRGIDFSDSSGRYVSNAGDVNGDGFDDILIGASQADPNGSASGETYLIYGSNSGHGGRFGIILTLPARMGL